MICHCADWAPNIALVNAPGALAFARNPGTYPGYTGVQFRYCPWCGSALEQESSDIPVPVPLSDKVLATDVPFHGGPWDGQRQDRAERIVLYANLGYYWLMRHNGYWFYRWETTNFGLQEHT